MIIRPILLIVSLAMLFGCVGTPKISPEDAEFADIANRINTGQNVPSYRAAWSAYLQSSQIELTGPKFQQYLVAKTKLDSGEITCDAVNWQLLTSLNYWSIKPHMAAAECYEKLGNQELAQQHNRAIEYLLKGILDSGDGEAAYSAYQVAALGDAHDIVELMGYEIVDYYGQLSAGRKAFHYVVVANDPKTGKQLDIYFDNQRFVHAVMDVPFPFLGLTDGWKVRALPSISGGREIKVPLADSEYSDGNVDRAHQLYMEAIAEGSIRARYRLALIALRGEVPAVSPDQGVQLLLEAADKQYVPAIVVLSYLYDKGIVVPQDRKLAKQLAETVGKRKQPGYAYFALAEHLSDGLLTEPDKEAAGQYYHLAAKAGNVEAKLALFFQKLEQSKTEQASKASAEKFTVAELNELKTIAGGGSKWAHYLVARWIEHIYLKGTPEYNEAEDWLKKAAAFHIPAAYNALGDAYKSGDFGAKDSTKALANYVDAAIRYYPDSMLQVGYYNEFGIVVQTNFVLATRWYAMCYSADNVICTTNLGWMFLKGRGVARNTTYARELFEEAAAKNHPRAFNELANLYRNGVGVEKNIAKAIEYYKKAAELGYGYGHYNLGMLLKEGAEVPQDLNKAREHFLAAKDTSDAKKQLSEIEQILGQPTGLLR